MRHPSLKRTLIAAVFSLFVASFLLVGTAPVNSQSNPNSQGIPQQIAALEKRVAALSQQLTAFSKQLTTFDQRLTAFATPNAPAGVAKGVRVVDANGTEVGPMISRSEVVRKLGDVWLILGVGPSGFAESVPMFYNTSPDCRGTRYMGDTPDLLKSTSIVGGRVYYGDGNPQPVEVSAYEYVYAGSSDCFPISPYTPSLSRVVFTVLPAFSPPFTVRYDQ